MKKKFEIDKENSTALLDSLESNKLNSGEIKEIVVSDDMPSSNYIVCDNKSSTGITGVNIGRFTSPETQTHEVLFVDTGVEKYEALVDALLSNKNSHIDVILLDTTRDGIIQISELLNRYQNLDAIHIIAHGDHGNINIGNTSLNQTSLNENLLPITSWVDSFNENADIFIYGCKLAQTNLGTSLINSLSELTLTNVAACDDLLVTREGITAAVNVYTLVSGAPIVINPLANDTNAQNDILGVIEIIDTANSHALTTLNNAGDTTTLATGTTIQLLSDGRLKVTASSDGTQTFNYRISDSGASDVEAVTLNITSNQATAEKIGFVTTWDTALPGTSANNTIELLVNNKSNNYTVYWGDGSCTKGASGNISHTYAVAGNYTVAIVGDMAGFAFDNSGDIEKITSIEQWGNIVFENLAKAFDGATNLVYNANDLPDLTYVTDLTNMFSKSSFNGDISNWDTSKVTHMTSMFFANKVFNQDISNWDTSSVVDMSSMFEEASAFNKNIGIWKTGNVHNMANMFNGAASFNQNIGNWDTRQVTNMCGMFMGAVAFNQDISGWETGNVSDMENMFNSARQFNQNIATVIGGGNQGAIAWDTNNILTMAGMFKNASAFNQDISSWDTAAVFSMSDMFHSAQAFNQNISSWNTSRVTSMQNMFLNATSFDQSLGELNILFVTDMSDMLSNSGLSTNNYNSTLIGWSNQLVQSNVTLGVNGLVFSEKAIAPRGSLIVNDNWIITGDIKTNYASTYNGALDSSATFVKDGLAVVINEDASLTDAELDLKHSSNGNYSGAALSTDRTLISATRIKDEPTLEINLHNSSDPGIDKLANYQPVLRTKRYHKAHPTLVVQSSSEESLCLNENEYSTTASDTTKITTQVSALVVTNTSDKIGGDTRSIDALLANTGGDGISLREAIIAANNSDSGSRPVVINFNLAEDDGPHTITLNSALPVITSTVIIDGSSEPNFTGTPIVILDGNGVENAVITLGPGASGSIIQGLIIRNADFGIWVQNGSNYNVISGNWIGQFNADGSDAGAGNIILQDAILVEGGNNTIGGTLPNDRNVIIGGIYLYAGNAANNTILGNFFGTDTTGNDLLQSGNRGNGITATDGANNNVIGGITQGHRNIFGGLNDALHIGDPSTEAFVIQNNWIGLGADGTSVISNDIGVLLYSSKDHLIGGMGNGNVIVGSGRTGIWLFQGCENLAIQGNYIGMNESGSVVASNNIGIRFDSNSTNILIGGVTAGEGNVITANVSAGILIDGESATVGNSFLGNHIFNNEGLGIDIINDGVLKSDAGDGDCGGNKLQNYPVLTSAIRSGNKSVFFNGSLNTNADTTYRIEFLADATAEESDPDKIEPFVDFTNITSDDFGYINYSATCSKMNTNNEIITATANLDLGNRNYGGSPEFVTKIAVKTNKEDVTLILNTQIVDEDTLANINSLCVSDVDAT